MFKITILQKNNEKQYLELFEIKSFLQNNNLVKNITHLCDIYQWCCVAQPESYRKEIGFTIKAVDKKKANNNKKRFYSFVGILLCMFLFCFSTPTKTYAAVIDINASSQSDDTLSIPESVENVDESVIPTSYNAVEKNVVTPVKNQKADDCWTYTAMSNAESFLLTHTNLFPNLFPLYSVSSLNLNENHLDCWGLPDTTGNGWQRSIGEGGYPYISLGYFSGWNGPLLETENATTGLGITSICYLSKSNPNLIKKKIMENGSVISSFNINYNGYSSDNTSYALTKSIKTMNAHSITIVGWDDNYNRYNFDGSYLPEKNGAWLCKNSWGNYNSLGGYIYISYEDYYIFDDAFFGPNYTIDNAVNIKNTNYSLYQNEKYGATYEFQYVESTENSFFNVFDFSEKGNNLDKIVFETLSSGSNYKLYYVPLATNNKPNINKKEWKLLDSGVVKNAGYVCCDISDTRLPKRKGAIAVVLSSDNKYLSDNSPANCIGVSEWLCDSNDNMIYYDQGQKNKSYFLFNNKMVDVMDYYHEYMNDNIGGNFVIKAITNNDPFCDVNLDNKINIRDATSIQLYLIRYISLNEKQIENADFNEDGIVDINDVTAIQLMLLQ